MSDGFGSLDEVFEKKEGGVLGLFKGKAKPDLGVREKEAAAFSNWSDAVVANHRCEVAALQDLIVLLKKLNKKLDSLEWSAACLDGILVELRKANEKKEVEE